MVTLVPVIKTVVRPNSLPVVPEEGRTASAQNRVIGDAPPNTGLTSLILSVGKGNLVSASSSAAVVHRVFGKRQPRAEMAEIAVRKKHQNSPQLFVRGDSLVGRSC